MATTPVFLPGKTHGQRSLEGYDPWDRKELDMTEVAEHTRTGELRLRIAVVGMLRIVPMEENGRDFMDVR